MTVEQMKQVMQRVFAECEYLREQGQKEYAGGADAFGNFNRLGAMLGIDRKAVLMVYATKHFDGVMSHIRGHVSQREDVRGRINDFIVYFCLLRGMLDEERDAGAEPQPPTKDQAVALFDVLDQIDTALDTHGRNPEAFKAKVEALVKKRFDIATSDGYRVTFKPSDALRPPPPAVIDMPDNGRVLDDGEEDSFK